MKSTRQRLVALIVALLAVGMASGALAQDVLVWSAGNEGGSTQGVANYLVATGLIDSAVASQNVNLTLADLLNYDAVLFFTNGCAGDMVAIGNVLADYADTGRRLVLATFTWANQGCNTLAGRIITDGISPFVFDGTTLYSSVVMDWNDGHPFFGGVTSLSGFYHDDVTTVAGATLHATWNDGQPLLAERLNVVAVNLFPDDYWGNIGGDYDTLFANTLAWLVTGAAENSLSTIKSLY